MREKDYLREGNGGFQEVMVGLSPPSRGFQVYLAAIMLEAMETPLKLVLPGDFYKT